MTADHGRLPILYLTHHLPWPPHSGGRLREAELLRRLAPDFDIEVVAISKTPALDRSHLAEAAKAGVHATVFAAVPTQSPDLSPQVRRHQSPEARRYLCHRLVLQDGALETSALIHVEGHYLFDLLPPAVGHRTLILEYNVESSLYEQRAELSANWCEQADLLADAERTRRTERECWRRARLVAAVTEDDAHTIRQAIKDRPVPVIPSGADHLRPPMSAPRHRPSDAGQLVFIANFGYAPNLDAAHNIVTDLFPRIRSRCPDATFTFVGPAPPSWLLHKAATDPHIAVTGVVPDVAAYLDAAEVVLCPLRIGGGAKIKVLEAMARGRAVVTTPVGMQGLRHLGPDATVVCDRTDAIVDACVRLLRSPADRALQQARATRAAQRLPTWDHSAHILASTWRSLTLDRLPAVPAGS